MTNIHVKKKCSVSYRHIGPFFSTVQVPPFLQYPLGHSKQLDSSSWKSMQSTKPSQRRWTGTQLLEEVHIKAPSEQLSLEQPDSSSLKRQSGTPSHSRRDGIHSVVEHRNSIWPQSWGGGSREQSISSDPSRQSCCPLHFPERGTHWSV